jgi:hypothetical protein
MWWMLRNTLFFSFDPMFPTFPLEITGKFRNWLLQTMLTPLGLLSDASTRAKKFPKFPTFPFRNEGNLLRKKGARGGVNSERP